MLALIVLWVVFAIGVGFYASTRGRSGLAWFGVALLVSPLICLVILTVAPDASSVEGSEHSATVVAEATAAEVLHRLEILFERGALTRPEIDQLRSLAARELPVPKSRKPATSELTRACPRCGKLVHAKAKTCMHCWAKLQRAA